MFSWSIFWLMVRVVFTLAPAIWNAIREEQQKQSGRDEIVKAVLERFRDVQKDAEKHRDDARARIDDGVRDDQFFRD